jgi:hypothetical protein
MTDPGYKNGSWTLYSVVILCAMLIVGGLAWLMVYLTRPADLNAARALERAKAQAELTAQNHEALTTYGWIDQGKGIVRLPIDRAMELALKQWQNPAAARTDLVARVEKASAKPPEKPSAFE